MLPTYKERIASVIRALSVAVVPVLPKHEALAIEQLQLAIHHLQIIHDQFDDQRAGMDEESIDALRLADELLSASGEPVPTPNEQVLRRLVDNHREGESPRQLISAVCSVIEDVYRHSSMEYRARITQLVANHEVVISNKEREIFKEFGFDNII